MELLELERRLARLKIVTRIPIRRRRTSAPAARLASVSSSHVKGVRLDWKRMNHRPQGRGQARKRHVRRHLGRSRASSVERVVLNMVKIDCPRRRELPALRREGDARWGRTSEEMSRVQLTRGTGDRHGASSWARAAARRRDEREGARAGEGDGAAEPIPDQAEGRARGERGEADRQVVGAEGAPPRAAVGERRDERLLRPLDEAVRDPVERGEDEEERDGLDEADGRPGDGVDRPAERERVAPAVPVGEPTAGGGGGRLDEVQGEPEERRHDGWSAEPRRLDEDEGVGGVGEGEEGDGQERAPQRRRQRGRAGGRRGGGGRARRLAREDERDHRERCRERRPEEDRSKLRRRRGAGAARAEQPEEEEGEEGPERRACVIHRAVEAVGPAADGRDRRRGR